MSLVKPLSNYIAQLSLGKIALWCYLIWYLVTVARFFDQSPAIWLNSLGISAVIGTALLLSISRPMSTSGGRWQTFRLFFMPFAVSSFSSLIKGRGFVIIIPPGQVDLAISAGSCIAFVATVFVVKYFHQRRRG